MFSGPRRRVEGVGWDPYCITSPTRLGKFRSSFNFMLADVYCIIQM